jgi:O-antigen/teichoic acid export membrane protein
VTPPTGDQLAVAIGVGIAVGLGTYLGARKRHGSVRRASASGVLSAVVKLALATLDPPTADWLAAVANGAAVVVIIVLLAIVLRRTIEQVRQDPSAPS